MSTQTKNIVFTWNNWDLDDLEKLTNTLNELCTFYCYGKEGLFATPHLQGYAEFKGRHRLSWYAKLFNNWHIEPRKGTAQQAKEYCEKEGDFFQYGDISGSQGTRSDLVGLYESLKSGATLRDISDGHFKQFLRYERAIRSYRLIHGDRRNWETEVFVLWGKTGTGKTRHVHDNEVDEDVYVHPGGPWFDGYDGHTVVLFDDFSGSCFPIAYLLKLLDRYPFSVPVKGAFVSFTPRRIYITSNIDPDQWYCGAHTEHVNALRRRFTKVTHFDSFFQ